MDEIFLNQPVTLYWKTQTDLTDATVQVIKYIKSDGTTTGELTATIDDIKGGILKCIIAADVLDQAGEWVFWPYITFGAAGSVPGVSYTKEVYNEGAMVDN